MSEVKKEISKITKDKKIKSGKELKSKLEKKKNELDELVDSDGSFLSSKVPIYNPQLSPKGTTDQEVVMNRQTNNPVTRGYRVYWGESVEETPVLEINMKGAFGYKETENKDYKNTVKTLTDMGVENPVERAKEFGKIPRVKKKKGKLKQRLSEKEQIEEAKKEKMKKMVEDIVLNKKNSDSEINSLKVWHEWRNNSKIVDNSNLNVQTAVVENNLNDSSSCRIILLFKTDIIFKPSPFK
jgi:hypothetical protein